MKHLLPTLLTALLCSGLFGQTFTLNNYMAGGSTGGDGISDIITDAAGNTYVTGYFSGTVDFDPGPGVYNLNTPLGSNWDAFVQKLDVNGNLVWAKSFRGTYDDVEMGENLAIDDSGNVYLQGYFQRNIFFTPSGTQWPGNPNIGSSTFNFSPFLVKLDSLGNVKWGLGWKNNTQTGFSSAHDITLDIAGNIYLVGRYKESVDFDPTSASVKMLTNTSGLNTDAFVVKLSNAGQVIDASNAGIPTIIEGSDSDAGGIYVSGTGRIQKLNNSLGAIWLKQFIGISNTEIKVSPNGYLYVCGTFSGMRDFDPSPTSTYYLDAGSGSRDYFILKLDTAGNFIWAKALHSSSNASMFGASSLSLNSTEDVAFSGEFINTLDADPDTSNYLLTSAGQLDAFVILLDSSGTFKAAANVGGTGDDKFLSVHFKANNEMLVGGRFVNTIDIDPSGTVNLITSNGQRDFMMLNLNLCNNAATTYLTDTACASYTLPSGSATYTTSGTYTDVLTNAQGCDSVLEINVTIVQNNLNPTISQTNNGLEGYVLGGSSALQWEWIDCQTGLPVPNATNQIFMPTYNGSFRVKVSDGICTATSSCFNINNVSVRENDLAKSVLLYPNPTSGFLYIQSEQLVQKVEVLDLTGRLVFTQNKPSEEIDLSTLPKGMYLVKMYLEQGVGVQRILKM